MTKNELWNNWVEEEHYGEMFYKRATGELEEMESSKSVSNLIKKIYREGDKLLDIGCGTGHYLKSLRRIISDSLAYTGIDPTEYYIELAQKAYGDTANFKVGNIFSIPEPDDSFEIVMCNNVVMHLPPEKLKEAFDELIRVSRGKVIIRAMFGERNYITKEILKPADLDPSETSDFVYPDLDLSNSKFRYFNMYTEDYYRQLVGIERDMSIDIQKDTDWGEFNNIPDSKINTATKAFGEYQLSGNLLLDWRYIIIDTKKSI